MYLPQKRINRFMQVSMKRGEKGSAAMLTSEKRKTV
jgi:hypothetical protein